MSASGRDAEEYKLKQAKKASTREGPPDDHTGKLGKLSGADYLDLITAAEKAAKSLSPGSGKAKSWGKWR